MKINKNHTQPACARVGHPDNGAGSRDAAGVHPADVPLTARLSNRPASPDPMAITSPALPAGRVLPLYIRVAQWAMSLGRPVSRDEVAQAFSTTSRRAADIMLYINGPGARVIESERLLVAKEGGGRASALMRVTMVWPERYTPSRAGRPRGRHRRTLVREAPSQSALRDLFFGRRANRGRHDGCTRVGGDPDGPHPTAGRQPLWGE